MKFTGSASDKMPGDARTVWHEACSLDWLKGIDEVIFTDPVEVGSTFTIVEDRWRITCQFTRVEPPIALSWKGEDGSSGTLDFEPMGDVTKANYRAVYVPKAAADKFAAGLISGIARSKAQRETDNDASHELRNLAYRVKRRVGSKPSNDRAPRFMLELCSLGADTPDRCTIPRFDTQGQLLLEHEEKVLWTGAATLAAEAAQAAGGREQFKTMWKSNKKAAVSLTDQRLVYDICKISEGDISWYIIGDMTGLELAANSVAKAKEYHFDQIAAGQIRHENLANLITGANARTTFAGPTTVTATVIEPPKRVIRLHLIVDRQAEEIAQRWTQAAATQRLQRLENLLRYVPDKHRALLAQQEYPKPHTGYWGPLWGLPLSSPLGKDIDGAPNA